MELTPIFDVIVLMAVTGAVMTAVVFTYKFVVDDIASRMSIKPLAIFYKKTLLSMIQLSIISVGACGLYIQARPNTSFRFVWACFVVAAMVGVFAAGIDARRQLKTIDLLKQAGVEYVPSYEREYKFATMAVFASSAVIAIFVLYVIISSFLVARANSKQLSGKAAAAA